MLFQTYTSPAGNMPYRKRHNTRTICITPLQSILEYGSHSRQTFFVSTIRKPEWLDLHPLKDIPGYAPRLPVTIVRAASARSMITLIMQSRRVVLYRARTRIPGVYLFVPFVARYVCRPQNLSKSSTLGKYFTAEQWRQPWTRERGMASGALPTYDRIFQ